MELLNVYDENGQFLSVKDRAEVHADGDWHEIVFVLAAREDEASQDRFFLQIRSGTDDRYQGQVDIFVGGHVNASEDHLAGAVREAEEEAGIHLTADDLLYLGRRSITNRSGVCRRVIQHFYLCKRPVSLADFTPTDEASGFLEVGIDDFMELVEGKRKRITARGRFSAESSIAADLEVTSDMLREYSDIIMDTFIRSINATRFVLMYHRPDLDIWR